MVEYLIAANEEWVPHYSKAEIAQKSAALQVVRAQMKTAGVYVFLGGLDPAAPVFSVQPREGSPVFTDGPYAETKEHLGGFVIIDVVDDAAARLWAGKVSLACGWPHEVRRFQAPSTATDEQMPLS